MTQNPYDYLFEKKCFFCNENLYDVSGDKVLYRCSNNHMRASFNFVKNEPTGFRIYFKDKFEIRSISPDRSKLQVHPKSSNFIKGFIPDFIFIPYFNVLDYGYEELYKKIKLYLLFS